MPRKLLQEAGTCFEDTGLCPWAHMFNEFSSESNFRAAHCHRRPGVTLASALLHAVTFFRLVLDDGPTEGAPSLCFLQEPALSLPKGWVAIHSNHMLNRGHAYTTIISSKDHGRTLLSHLASLYPHSTPQVWQQNLDNREVTVNGVTANGRESLISGQTLVWNRPPWIEPDTPQHFEVLFDDPHLLAVNKPGGLPTLPGGGFMENTLLRLVQKQTPNANPVHRLGRATTGIVLFAKTAQAAAKLGADWNTPRIQKIYWALAQNLSQQDVQNNAQQDAYEILTPIGLVPHPRIGSVWAASAEWQAGKVIGEGDLTGAKQHGAKQHTRHHNI